MSFSPAGLSSLLLDIDDQKDSTLEIYPQHQLGWDCNRGKKLKRSRSFFIVITISSRSRKINIDYDRRSMIANL